MGFGESFSQGLMGGINAGLNMKMMKSLMAGHKQTPIASAASPDALDESNSNGYEPSSDIPEMPEL
ncbi:MAG: hypothetical protein KGH87_09595 [Thaumarchaeota archaeon]|nr:hypothetical protein [Nitrososphaerota archaeon]MDE1840158.1 hypothetical protein [Nitrososphaerota archaeon]